MCPAIPKNAVAVHCITVPLRVFWERESQAVDTLLVFVVFTKLQHMGGSGLALVPRLQRERESDHPGMFAPCRMPCWAQPEHWAGVFFVPDIGVFTVLLDGADMRSPVSMAKAAAGWTGCNLDGHCCDCSLGR